VENKETHNPDRFEYYYEVTPEQIKQHQQRSVAEIFAWIENTLELLDQLQSPEAKENWKRLRRNNINDI
jgi:hypothetical protein